nr:hypothetical protein [Tanacetum cinerariifolium]
IYATHIFMENPNHPNDLNVPEDEQAPAAPDGFAPQWIGEHDPNNNNGWVEWDVPLGGELDEPMVDPEVNEESTYEIGGPSTAVVERPSSPLPAPRLPVPPTVIEDLGTRLGNLEYRHGVLTRKIEEVSDAEVADNIVIGEMSGYCERVGTGDGITGRASGTGRDRWIEVTKMESHVDVVMSHMLWMEERLTVLEKRLPGPPPGPQ